MRATFCRRRPRWWWDPPRRGRRSAAAGMASPSPHLPSAAGSRMRRFLGRVVRPSIWIRGEGERRPRSDSGRRSRVVKLQHYIGGLEGLPEPLSLEPLSVEKRVFVEDWEKRIFGIHVAMMGLSKHLGTALPKYPIGDVPTTFKDYWTWGHLRSSAEAMDPIDYFRLRYYERWLGGITQFLIDKGYLSAEELASRVEELMANDAPSPGSASPAVDEQIVQYLRNGDSPRRDVAHPRFAPGDRVRIRNVPA